MRLKWLILSGLFTAAFSFATWLEPWFQSWSGSRTGSGDILGVALGDSRRLFAKHAYVKADAYFHGGYYPSIFDERFAPGESHMASEARDKDHDETSCSYLGKPKDWIDSFSRHFYPSVHRHLGEEPDPHHAGKSAAGQEREILPWLRLSASLDPEQIDTYVVGSYWMRTHLGKINEAEQFLREGLRANPGNCELLFELGRISFENRKTPNWARNLWELALESWHKQEAAKSDKNILLYAQILGNLAKLEEGEQHYAKAIEYLTALKVVSPRKDSLQKWIEELKGKL